MSTTKYNLDEQVGKDYFDFTLGEHNYKMTYPSSKDVMQLSEIASGTEDLQLRVEELQAKLESASEQEKTTLNRQLSEATERAKLAQTTFLEWCSRYITSDADAPDITEQLMSKSVKYLLAFSNMVKTELNEG